MVSVAREVQAPSARPAPLSLGCRQDPGSAPGGGSDVRCCEGAAGDPSGLGRQAGLAPGEQAGVPASCSVHSQRWCRVGTPVRDAVLPLMSAFLDQDVWAA